MFSSRNRVVVGTERSWFAPKLWGSWGRGWKRREVLELTWVREKSEGRGPGMRRERNARDGGGLCGGGEGVGELLGTESVDSCLKGDHRKYDWKERRGSGMDVSCKEAACVQGYVSRRLRLNNSYKWQILAISSRWKILKWPGLDPKAAVKKVATLCNFTELEISFRNRIIFLTTDDIRICLSLVSEIKRFGGGELSWADGDRNES